AKVYRKLAQLNTALNKAAGPAIDPYETSSADPTNRASVDNSDVERLEAMMHTMNSSKGEDPEVQQLNGMLESILDIQHPERVREKIKQASAAGRGQVFPVAIRGRTSSISLLENSTNSSALDGPSFPQLNSFYSLADDVAINDQQNAIEA